MLVTIGLPFKSEEARHFSMAVRSIFSQTHRDWQLILLSDSADPQLVDLASDITDSRVRLIQLSKPCGLPTALNTIALHAAGDVLFRMDADDVMNPERVSQQATYLHTHPNVDLVATRAFIINETNHIVGVSRHQPMPQTTADLLRTTPFIHPTVAASTQWFRDNPYDIRLKRSQDKDLWLRSSPHTTFAKLDEPLIYYRVPQVLSYHKYASTSALERTVIRTHGPRSVGIMATGILTSRSIARQLAFGALIALKQGERLSRRRSSPLTPRQLHSAKATLQMIQSQRVPGWNP